MNEISFILAPNTPRPEGMARRAIRVTPGAVPVVVPEVPSPAMSPAVWVPWYQLPSPS